MLTWLTGTTAGKAFATFVISMVPIVELRGGLPYGIALGLDYPLALAMAVMGNSMANETHSSSVSASKIF